MEKSQKAELFQELHQALDNLEGLVLNEMDQDNCSEITDEENALLDTIYGYIEQIQNLAEGLQVEGEQDARS